MARRAEQAERIIDVDRLTALQPHCPIGTDC
ncbi:hypothetical protein BPC006_I3076 [Burkholderia pseudomallei BPC006]|nr:hypothetical protein BPC006_I3076 [Burkholderia pseudomallei BPC006]